MPRWAPPVYGAPRTLAEEAGLAVVRAECCDLLRSLDGLFVDRTAADLSRIERECSEALAAEIARIRNVSP